MPVSYASGAIPAIHVIHENADWTAPLFDALEARGLPYVDWNMAYGDLALSEAPPQGVFYNRMSASSHTRGNRYAPEVTAGVLAWLEGHGRRVINGRSALNLEISKLVQYPALHHAGLDVPETVAATDAGSLIEAFSRFDGKPVITKHNRAGKGLGVRLFRSRQGLAEYVNSTDFDPSVDGITLVQRYITSPDQTITRVEFIGRKLAYAVRVDTSNGFALCPADVCSLEASTCMADAAPRFAFEVVDGFAESDLGQLLVPRMQTVMADEGLDVAAFEFILDPDGRPYVYDINTNTNYNSDAESRAGVSAMGQLAAYLGDELEARYPAESRRAS